jgi:hypothetical protein
MSLLDLIRELISGIGAPWEMIKQLIYYAIFPLEFIATVFWYVFYILAIFAAGFLSFVIIGMALVMVFSFDRSPLRMFEKIFKNLIWYYGLIFKLGYDLLMLAIQAAQVLSQAFGGGIKTLASLL